MGLFKSKEEREAKEVRTYIGNGKVVWNDGSIVTAERVEQVTNTEQNPGRDKDMDDLLDF